MSRTDLSNIPVYCVVCTTEVPPERRKHKSVTCSKEHQRARELSLRSRADLRLCRYCKRPSTPEQRGEFLKWRNLQAKTGRTGSLQALAAGLRDGGDLLQLSAKDRKDLAALLGMFLAPPAVVMEPGEVPHEVDQDAEAVSDEA